MARIAFHCVNRLVKISGYYPLSKKQSDIKILGIISGGGDLPSRLIKACQKKDIEPFVVGIKGQTDPALLEGHRSMMGSFSKAGQILKTLKAHNVTDIVMIGSMKRPSFSTLCPDLYTASLITRIGFKALGDDGLLQAIRKIFESEGITIHGVQEFVDELLAVKGAMGCVQPSDKNLLDIERGVNVAHQLGALDVGQSVVVQDGFVLGVEAVEGTDALLDRCSELKKSNKGGVLVKLCKPQQDKRLDMPTIGLSTIQKVYESGFQGIAVQAGSTLVVDLEEMVDFADKHKMFICGLEIEKDGSIVR